MGCGKRRGLFVPEGDAALGKVIGRHFDIHLVARQNADAVLAHLARGVGQDFVAIVQLDAEHGVGKDFGNDSFKLEQVFFGHLHSFWFDFAGKWPFPAVSSSRMTRAVRGGP